MKVSCPSCQTNYNIDDKRIPAGGAKLKCAKCQSTFPVQGPGSAAAPSSAVPLPGSPGGAARAVPPPGSFQNRDAVPLPAPVRGTGPTEEESFEDFDGEKTHVGAIPLPGAAFRDDAPRSAGNAIPLPGNDQDFGFDDAPPARAAGKAVPLPGNGQDFSFEAPSPTDAASGDAVPLPGSGHEGGLGAVPLPGHGTSPASPDANVFSAKTFSGKVDFDTAMDFGFADEPAGASSAPQAFEVNLPPPPAPRAAAISFELEAPAAPAAPDELDFAALPPAPSASPAPADFDFDIEAPPGTPADAGKMDFSIPDPASADGDFSFDPVSSAPSPKASPLPEPPAQPFDPSADFGDVDFSDPPAVPESPGKDPLDFDSGASAAAAPATPGDDGLEMLDFVDEGSRKGPAPVAAEAAEVSRYQVRRRSGKVFGPFENAVVAKMLEDGQLLGNEDVSIDGETWSPINSVPAFAAAIARPAAGPDASSSAGGGSSTPSAPPPVTGASQAERLQSLYQGRMAAVAVVDRSASTERLRKMIPIAIAAAIGIVVVVTGFSLGATQYGVFGLKLLFPAKVSEGSPEFATLQKAKKALLLDTFKSYQDARDAAEAVLKVKEYPEARAVWCQAVFYLQRRYASATPAQLKDAVSALDSLPLLGKKHPEVVKAQVGSALLSRDSDKAIPMLEDAISRGGNETDPELQFLRAEGYAQKGQTKVAMDSLTRLTGPAKGSAKALHALGNLYQGAKNADLAAKAYGDALKADPNHVGSAVELAALELLIHKNIAQGNEAVDQALSGERRKLLGPAELAKASALKGIALAMEFKPREATTQFEEALKLDPDSFLAKAGLARVLLSQREYDKALPLFKNASQHEPQNLEYTDGYLSTLIATGKMSDALKEVQAANTRFPGNARISFLNGRVNDALNRNREAESHYIHAVTADPTLVDADLALAKLYLRLHRSPEARPRVEAALAQAPKSAAVHSAMGELLFAEGEFEKARAEFTEGVGEDPSLSDPYLGLANVALATGASDDALVQVDKALDLDSHIKEGRLTRGLVLWKLKRLDDAAKELDKAKLDDPKSAKILITLGAVQTERSDFPAAETSLRASLALEPSNPEAHFWMARVKSRRGEYSRAIESMKTALDRAPKRADYHYEMGLIFRDAKRLAEAIAEWKATLDIDPSHADAFEALGQAYLDKGEVEKATGYFQEALKADPKRLRVVAMIGDCYFQAANWKEAIAQYQSALAADPSLKQINYKVARAYSEKGQRAEAVKWYHKATELDPENAMPYFYLGYSFKESGSKKEAIAAFKTYLQKLPTAEDKKEIEDEIYYLEQGK